MESVKVEKEEVLLTKKHLGAILTILTILSIICSAAIATGIKSQEIDQQSKAISELKESQYACEERLNVHETTLQVINTKLDSISEDIKEIKQDVKDINRGGLN